MSDPVVVCIHHPARPDIERLRACVEALDRAIEIECVPYKETLPVRSARAHPPLTPEVAARVSEPSEAVREAWSRAEVLLALDLPAEHLALLPRLRWVQLYSSGLDHIDSSAFEAAGIRLTSAACVAATSIAEFVMARLLEVWKQLRAIEAMQRKRAMQRPAARLLSGSTLGVVGFGAIGRAVAECAHALGMRVRAVRKHPERDPKPAFLESLGGTEALPELLSACDAVVLCAPATQETANLIDAKALGRMPPGSVLCNVARGSLVDELALVDALASGRLGAAILDVTREEPLPPDSPLWNTENLYLSPHCAVSPEAYESRLVDLFAENLRRYVAEKPLLNQVESGSS